MTETTDRTDLPDPLDAFVLQWGEMGRQWGVNRSVARIHAFLYLAEEPTTAERIADALGIARSNVSNSLKELVAWKLVRQVPVRGERRDHFVAETDVWEIAMRIAQGRKEREIDPALAVLEDCAEGAAKDEGVTVEQRRRIAAMLDFTRDAERWYAQMAVMPRVQREMLMKLGSRVVALLPKRNREG